MFDRFEINSEFGKCGGKWDAIPVFESPCFFKIEMAGKCGRAEQAFSEAGTFLVRPVNQADGDGWFPFIFGVDSAHDFHPGHEVQAAVEPAAIGHGVDVPADEQAFFGCTGEGEPEVTGGVGVGLHGKFCGFFDQPFPRLGPGGRECDPLGAVIITSQLTQLFEVVDGALGMQKAGRGFHERDMSTCTLRARIPDFLQSTKRISTLASAWGNMLQIIQMDEGGEPREIHARLNECWKWIHPLLALVALGCLLVLVGWTGDVSGWQHLLTVGIGFAFAVERAWSLREAWPQERERRRLVLRGVLALLVLGLSLALLVPGLWGSGKGPLAGHLFVQIAVLVSGVALMISHQKRFTARAFHPGLLLIGSFLFIVVVGALLLKMPRCTVAGETSTWLDVFFTSTSAVCVTGLSVQNTALHFTTTGQTVILLLIQVGGLGIMTLTFFAAVVLFEGLTLHDRLLLGKMIQENRLARIGETLKFIVIMTFACEGLGAVVLFFSLDGIPALSTRWFHAVFHSVSAFCNAGFSSLPDGLATGVIHGNWVWQVVIMSLIVIGGLGALVNEDVSIWSVAKMRRWLSREGPRRRLRVHTRLVLVTNTLLIAGGAALILVTEFALRDGPENGGTVLTAVFHSVTARTAGFNTVVMSEIGVLTAQVLMVLMIIGGSPGGTAGGLRTTVAAVGVVHLWHQLRGGKRGMVFFNRSIPLDTGSQALGLIFLTGIWLAINFVILQFLQTGSGVSETSLLFELISAFATVGLSIDLTPTLRDGAKTLLIVNMFVGRVGLLTVMATLIKPDTRPSSGKPQEDILLT